MINCSQNSRNQLCKATRAPIAAHHKRKKLLFSLRRRSNSNSCTRNQKLLRTLKYYQIKRGKNHPKLRRKLKLRKSHLLIRFQKAKNSSHMICLQLRILIRAMKFRLKNCRKSRKMMILRLKFRRLRTRGKKRRGNLKSKP